MITKGEWTIHAPERFHEDRILITSEPDGNGYYEFACHVYGKTVHEVRLANAHLIATAPDMYKFLQEELELLLELLSKARTEDDIALIEGAINGCEAVLAKAEGKEVNHGQERRP